ncbi:protein MMS22-like [Ixodes scapularis]
MEDESLTPEGSKHLRVYTDSKEALANCRKRDSPSKTVKKIKARAKTLKSRGVKSPSLGSGPRRDRGKRESTRSRAKAHSFSPPPATGQSAILDNHPPALVQEDSDDEEEPDWDGEATLARLERRRVLRNKLPEDNNPLPNGDAHPRSVTCHIPLEAPYIWLFGRAFYRRRFSQHHLTELFWAARAQIFELFAESRCHEIVIAPSGVAKLQQDVSTFFSYLRHEVERLLDDPNSTMDVARLREEKDVLSPNEFCIAVLREVHQTLLCIGHICDLPQAATAVSPSSNAAALFHLCLEVWWSAFQVADRIASSAILKGSDADVCFCDLDAFGQGGPFSQVAVILLWDLCCLASRSYGTSSVAASERRAFCCDCVRHLWEMVMDVIHRRQEHHGEEPFWAYLNFVLEALCRGSPTEPGGDVGEGLCSLLSVSKQGLRLTLGFPAGKLNLSSLACATGGDACTPAFCLWLLTSVAEVDGGCMWRKKGKSNYIMAKKFVQSATTNHGESDMRTILKCCITLHRLWEPSLELLLPLLEFFLKNLNNSFQEPSKPTGIQGLVLWKSGQQLYQQAKLRTEADTTRSSESSFELFLTLMARSLLKYLSSGATNLWRQLRGRIYSKFHTKKMQELTEMGLQNCSLLFLVLALSVEVEEVVKKELTLFEMLAAGTSPAKLSVIMRGMFASLLALQANGVDLASSAQQVAHWFFAHCLEKAGKSSDSSFLQQKAALLPLFLEGVADIFDASPDLRKSEHVLLGEGPCLLTLIFKSCHV